jgi:Alpha-(1,6)-fucosyltransferase N- and catalytic domains
MASKQGRYLIRVMRYLLLALLSFAIGRTWRTNHFRVYSLLPSTQKADDDLIFVPSILEGRESHASSFRSDLKKLLHIQRKEQAEIQGMIQRIMLLSSDKTDMLIHKKLCHSDDKTRIMVSQLEHPKDGFASEFQYMARLLQMAVSTQRTLIVTPQWRSAYEPLGCLQHSNHTTAASSGWDCLWEPLPVCSLEQLQEKKQARHSESTPTTPKKDNYSMTVLDSSMASLYVGILPQHKTTSTFFDTAWYSEYVIMQQAPISFARKDHLELRPDVLPHWERAYGRYWVRAQMAHALWRPNAALRQEIQTRMPSSLDLTLPSSSSSSSHHLFIGFHIRLTDNVVDLQRHFARNATATRNFYRFMQFAKRIRQKHDANNQHQHQQQQELRVIYLATDNQDVIAQANSPQWTKDWTFVVQKSVQRSSAGDQRMWFRDGRSAAAGGIATDIEVLRQADYLVGSFQSNVYRLACQLNTAFHAHKYAWQQQRHYTVDVEWYEDP